MTPTRLPLRANLADPLSGLGRRARRPEGAFRRFFDDRAVGFGPTQPAQQRRAGQQIVAQPTRPADDQSLRAPEQDAGWQWEDPNAEHESPLTRGHEAKSFQERFPATHAQPDTEVKAEAPSPYADAYMDASGQAIVPEPLVSTRADVAEPTILDIDSGQPYVPADSLLDAERNSAYQPVAEPIIDDGSSDQIEYEQVDYDQVEVAYEAMESAASIAEPDLSVQPTGEPELLTPSDTVEVSEPEANQPEVPKSGQTMSSIWAGSKRIAGSAVDGVLASAGWATRKAVPVSKRIGHTTLAAGSTALHAVMKPFQGASMKRQELPDNSLLELDEGHKVPVDQEGQEQISDREAKQLKKQGGKPNADAPAVTQDAGDNGVVGAVQLAPNSPMPREGRSGAIVHNPVTHGSAKTDEADYKISVTHAAPSKTESHGPLRTSKQRVNTVGLVVNGLLIVVGIIIALIIGSLIWGVMTGNAPTRAEPLATTAELSPVSNPAVVEPVAPPVSAAVDLSVGEVLELEGFLAQLSLDTGPVDGFADDATKAAVQEFEKILALEPSDGTLTKELQGEIRGFAFEMFGF